MNIGEFKLNNGRMLGWIATQSIDLPRLGLRPVESSNERAPAFEILALNVGKRWVQVGALWEATAKKTGEIFYQGSIDDPSLADPFPLALFGSEEEGFRAAWRRPERREDSRSSRGFGGSTADDGGHFGDSSGEIDDEIPF